VTDTEPTSRPPSSVRGTIRDEIDLLDYLRVIWRYRWSILTLCIVTMALTVVMLLREPRQYESTVTIVPPLDILQKESGSGLGLLNDPLLRQVMDTAVGSIAHMYVEILGSREVADAIVDRFHLTDVYEDIRYRSDARTQLEKNTKVRTTDGGAVKITVLDRDPNRVAAIAGAYVEELDRQNKRLSTGQATSKRVFLENRLKEVEAKLSKVDNILSREARIQENLYESLILQYEMAKMEEARSMPTIQVLDPPVVPERGVARGTVKKGLVAGFAAFMLGVCLAFVREYVRQARRRGAETSSMQMDRSKGVEAAVGHGVGAS
jgi:uncharacterized protein involved in exopolysaccharide biosynthesis